MNDDFYTFAYWKVKENKEMEFKDIWEKELSVAFLAINPYAKGTLIQSLDNPSIFYSFGPWSSLDLMQKARADKQVRTVIGKLASLCDEAKPGSFKKILSVNGSKQ